MAFVAAKGEFPQGGIHCEDEDERAGEQVGGLGIGN